MRSDDYEEMKVSKRGLYVINTKLHRHAHTHTRTQPPLFQHA